MQEKKFLMSKNFEPMRETPFFGNYRGSSRPRCCPRTKGFPVRRQVNVKHQSPKVVSAPARFPVSRKARTAAPLKIQKALRGFLVRKSVREILAIARELDEIDRRISQRETVDLIRRDAKERLKVNEMLMALLFRLDSVRGVGYGVRDCRKAVSRKSISLQERVDAIVAEDDRTLDMVDGGETKGRTPDVDDYKSKTVDNVEALVNSGHRESLLGAADQTLELQVSDQSRNKNDTQDATSLSAGEANIEENVETVKLPENMMGDNEKLMGLLAELFERNASLSHRVTQLEKAFTSEKLKSKNKRQSSTPDAA